MNSSPIRSRALILCTAFALLLVLPARALALDYHWWYWTTQNDANPLPYSECTRRAPDALTKAGLKSVKSGSDPNTFIADYDAINVMLMCIPQANGFNMVLNVVVSDATAAHGSSTDWGNAINNWFWGTQTGQPVPGGSAAGVATMLMTQTDTGWIGFWTRRGTSNAWDTVWVNGSDVRSTVSQGGFSGSAGSFQRTQSTDNYLCAYNLTLAGDGLSFSGTQTCPGLANYRVTGTATYSLCNSPVGSWNWWNGGTTTFRGDGTALHSKASVQPAGQWTPRSDGSFHIHWSAFNSDDYFTVSGNTMPGNYAGTNATSTRTSSC